MKKKNSSQAFNSFNDDGKPTYIYRAPQAIATISDERILAPEDIESYLNYDHPGPPVFHGRLSGQPMVWLSTDRRGKPLPAYYYVDGHDRVPEKDYPAEQTS